MLKELLLISTDFTMAIFTIPKISKHFSALLAVYNGKLMTSLAARP